MNRIVEKTPLNPTVTRMVIDAPQDTISALAGKIGALDGVSSKTAFSNVITHE